MEKEDKRKKEGFITLEQEAKIKANAKKVAEKYKKIDNAKVSIKVDSKTTKMIAKSKVKQFMKELRETWIKELTDYINYMDLNIKSMSDKQLIVENPTNNRAIQIKLDKSELYFANKDSIFLHARTKINSIL